MMPTPAQHSETPARRADRLIAEALRSGRPPDLAAEPGLSSDEFLERSNFHGVSALLLHRFPESAIWPPAVRGGLQQASVFQIAHELRHRQLLDAVIRKTIERGIRPILLKGTSLAYSLYASPELRARCDTDMLVRPEERAEAHAILVDTGFEKSIILTGTGVSYEAGYVHKDPAGISHLIDLHWRLNNSEVLSSLFTYDELAERSVPLPCLCAGARGLGPVDAMMLTCVHRRLDGRFAHRLIWLYDIHLLASGYTARDWDDLVRLSRAKGLARTVRDGIARARDLLGTPCPEGTFEELARPWHDVSEAYLRASPARREWMDFRARSFKKKLHYIRKTWFPSAEFMWHEYPGTPALLLPLLYVRRATHGVVKRISGKGDRH